MKKRDRLQFDTSDKKPKLYDLLLIAAVFAVLIGVLFLTGLADRPALVEGIVCIYCVIVLARLISALFGQIRYNPYSYNTIYYAGFALFTLSVIITHIVMIVQKLRYTEYSGPVQSLYILLGSAKTYMLLSFPFIFVFSAALCVSNISLIRHEGKRLVNVLGIILSFLLIAGEVFLFCADYYVSGSVAEVRVHELFTNFFGAVYLYFECMLIGAIIAGIIAARHEPLPDKDYLIILGCGLRKDGSPTPLLRGRCDCALAFRKKQVEETGKDLVFVTSGGQGPNEVISESASMKRYLMEQGVPAERIIEEDRSRSTFENMKFSKEKIEEAGVAGKIAFSTTNYHVFRGGLHARRVKMRADGMGAKTKWYFWPNAWVREFVGLLTEHRGKQAVILGCMIAAYVVMTLVVYR